MVAVIASFRWLGGNADFEVVRLGDPGSQMAQGLMVRESFRETVLWRARCLEDRKFSAPPMSSVADVPQKPPVS